MSTPPARASLGPTHLAALGADRGAEAADAVNESLEHLAPWMDWAHRRTTAQEQAMRLALADERRRAGGDATWMILDDDDRIIGGCGLHRRGGHGTMDIGYWLRPDMTGQGHATRAAATLSRMGFERLALQEIQIICDPANLRSANVARRLGYEHAGTRETSMVWVLEAGGWALSVAAEVAIAATFDDEFDSHINDSDRDED
jgi:RimJ/RimL family protein N-acetyltransferase